MFTKILDYLFKVSKRDNLNRYYIFKLFGFGLFIHRIHHDEEKDVFHNHPWNGISLIFGSYTEERFKKQRGTINIYKLVKKTCRFFNIIKAEEHHRVELPKGPVWTIFLHGRRKNHWSVIDRAGNVLDVEPWRGIGGRTSYKQ